MRWLLVLTLASCVRLPTPPVLVESDGVRRSLVPRVEAQPLEFSVTRHPGKEAWRLSQERGSVVLIDVWATWCEPCRDSLPFYDDLARQYAARGLKVYAMSVDADSSVIGPFVQELKLQLPVLHDPEANVAGSVLKVSQMPTTVLIDRRGVVRRVHEGLSDDFFQQTLTDVETLLAEPAKDEK
ncbi:MAG: TlpA family protein disulfide reductase [Archangiaceae bacterium]|nr:TlpA family protein disulfide reductase [Archangiaceae bacterium]